MHNASRLLVRNVMTPQVEAVDPREKLSEAARKMRDLDVGSLPVRLGERLIGIVTDRDIAVRGVAGEAAEDVRVESIMSPGVVMCYEDQSVLEAAVIMLEEKVRQLPVLNREKQLVGIVSLGDLAVRTDSTVSGQGLNGAPEVNSLLERPEETPPPQDRDESSR